MKEEFKGLGLVELIEHLEDVPQPSPISLTPQTPGWIILGVVIAGLLVLLSWWALQRYRAEAYRRVALRALEQAGDDPAAIATVLRRTALSAFPRDQVASLAGPDWLAFLDRTYSGSKFSKGAGKVLAVAPYQSQRPDPECAKLARDWIKRHCRNAEAT